MVDFSVANSIDRYPKKWHLRLTSSYHMIENLFSRNNNDKYTFFISV